MKITKKKGSFDDYTLEVSYGELGEIRDALSKAHNNAIADELYRGILWSMERVPRPGEEEDGEKETDLTKAHHKPDGEHEGDPGLMAAIDDELPDPGPGSEEKEEPREREPQEKDSEGSELEEPAPREGE